MEAIVKLLEDKNQHLKKFYEINEIELLNFVDGNFDNLEIFYQSRETILDLIRCIDGLVDDASKQPAMAVSAGFPTVPIDAMGSTADTSTMPSSCS